MVRKTALGSVAAAALVAAPVMAQDAIDVTLGVLNDRSGIYADLSGEGSVIAAQMAVEDFMAEDKGLNVEILSADHQNKPDVASNIARQWYDQDGVDAILDVPTSSAALAVADITAEMGGAFINSGAGSTELTRGQCQPTTVHWTYDTAALAIGTGGAMTDADTSWFFLTADYAFGHSLEEETSRVVEEAGGEVVGTVRHPFPATDFSSFLLQAQGSGANVIGLANAGGDTVNAIKQASEFGITQAGQSLAALLMFVTDVHALGAQTAQGLVLTEAFYWDLNDATREWSARFEERHGSKPTMVHAGVYSGTMHYLRGVEATGSTDGETVVEWMKANPFDDPLFGQGYVREDGRAIHDMYLFEVKTPEESTGEWDLYNLLATIPAEEAFLPMEGGGCEFVEAAG
ncbi:ABC transporter substrate-binding protein [Wenxinia marina]|uniref:Amino acid/amide ABC transporter substrate-binding protein, HAAT family n=1 Tax=Wenxinia marina DSM 24838 TaxID=1123501 RepID=A0A0D0Q421_9RHOB|nr:ABC transporter substrate-binding protein [Wenxinia marina]KIQ69249.1 amino acid/amide ABC transporter substrate-binding protein, HAAT family [Wenxinia marina DSM 24838]GGL71463.1 ABC transporter substrate-binding protein [Wenxinia marina]